MSPASPQRPKRPPIATGYVTSSAGTFCSFLALLLRKELDKRLTEAGVTAEWADVGCNLDRVEEIMVERGTKRFMLLPGAPGCAGSVPKAVGVALPPLVERMSIASSPQAAATPPAQPTPPRGARSA